MLHLIKRASGDLRVHSSRLALTLNQWQVTFLARFLSNFKMSTDRAIGRHAAFPYPTPSLVSTSQRTHACEEKQKINLAPVVILGECPAVQRTRYTFTIAKQAN